MRGLRVQSQRLGISGICDVVEFHRTEEGIALAGREGRYEVYPIEYKSAKRGIRLRFMTPNGRFLAQTCGEERGNVLLRKKQYRISDDPAQSCKLARSMIFGKTYNSRWVLERALRDHSMSFYELGNHYASKVEHIGAHATYEPEGVLMI